jgi:hypothetical protein
MHSPIAATALLEPIPRKPISPKAAARSDRAMVLTTRLLVRHVAQGSARPCPSRNASQPAHGLARGLVRPAAAPWPRVKMAP